MIPGEYFLKEGTDGVVLNAGRKLVRVVVRHTGDRPIQVGSHFHFHEVNRSLEFDRGLAYGFRLSIPAGTSVRFEPGETKEVSLTEFVGDRIVFGHNGMVNGPLSATKS